MSNEYLNKQQNCFERTDLVGGGTLVVTSRSLLNASRMDDAFVSVFSAFPPVGLWEMETSRIIQDV